MTRRIQDSFFEQQYRQNPDPWNFATSPYEQSRYKSIVGELKGRTYDRALEPGCSIGVLTRKLAPLCRYLLAIDVSPTAIASASNRCRDFPNVTCLCGSLDTGIPPSWFDLIVFSEIGYYFSAEALHAIATKLIGRLLPNGTFLAVHWLGHSGDHVLTGDQVHEILWSLPLRHISAQRHESFRLDRWVRS
jgi:SAM-dependent methyltransferase